MHARTICRASSPVAAVALGNDLNAFVVVAYVHFPVGVVAALEQKAAAEVGPPVPQWPFTQSMQNAAPPNAYARPCIRSAVARVQCLMTRNTPSTTLQMTNSTGAGTICSLDDL